MDYEAALKSCSEEVQAAIKWLEEHVKFDREKLENRLKGENREWVKEEFSRRLAVKYHCSDAIVFYALSKVNSPLVNDFLEAAKHDELWLDKDGFKGFDNGLFDPYLLWYLSKIGLDGNEYFKRALEISIKKRQTREGKIPVADTDIFHTLALRVLVFVEPDSESTNMAVRYFLDYFALFKRSHELDALAIGILALLELDHLKRILKNPTFESQNSYAIDAIALL